MKKGAMSLANMTGRKKLNSGFGRIMSVLGNFSEQEQDTLLADVGQEIHLNRELAAQKASEASLQTNVQDAQA